MPLWLSPHPLLLASKSAVRHALLVAAGIAVRAEPANIDERALEARLGAQDPSAVAKMLAHAKAGAVAAKHSNMNVLGADQTLALGGRRFSKPQNIAAAREQLLHLRGKTHTLHSGVAIVRGGELLFEYCETARLTMREFSDSFLDSYLQTVGNAALQSVGGYQLEAAGIQLFEKVEGDHSTILGLPLLPLLLWLREHGLLAK
jgi:septum formation protein